MNIGAIVLIGMIVMIVLGIPVGFAIGAASMFAISSGGYEMVVMPQKVFSGLDSFPLLAIPFFILAGNLMTHGGLNDRILDFASALVGHFRGSMAIITVVASAIFAAISGSGTATVSAIGGITIPAMKKQQYSDHFSAAVAISASILGPLIPPSIILIVYGNAVQYSISELFMGAVIPGVLLALLFAVYVYFYARRHKIPTSGNFDAKKLAHATKVSFWALLMPIIILGGIFSGVFTATEAAAISAVYAFIIGKFVYRNLSWKGTMEVLFESGMTAATLLFLLGCSKVSSWVLAVARVPEAVTVSMLSLTKNPVIILLLINVLLLIVGMFMEANVAVIMLTPILLPLAQQCGLSACTFGIVMCLNLCIGLLTPPVGLCALLGNGIAEAKFEETIKDCLIFIGLGLVVLMFTTYVPQLTMWLPGVLGTN